MVELLIVVLIIAVLLGMVAGAVFRIIGGQSERNTGTMLHKLHDGVLQQWSEASKQYRSPENRPPDYVVQTLAGGDPTRGQVIWMKLLLRREFPMNYAEIIDPAGGNTYLQPYLKPIYSYNMALNGRTKANDPTTESAACLLIALQNHPHKGMKFDAEEALGASAIRDTDGDGVPEIVDGWGKAIAFFRWGTGNQALDALARGGTGTLNRDTEDPNHKLMDSNWNNSNNTVGVPEFERLCHRIEVSGKPQSFFTIPVVVSAGKDGSFGLGFDMSPQNADANDNIYSFTLR